MSDRENAVSGWVDRVSVSLGVGGWAWQTSAPDHQVVISLRHGTIILGRAVLPSVLEHGRSDFDIQLHDRTAVAAAQALLAGELAVFADDVRLPLLSGTRHALQDLSLLRHGEALGGQPTSSHVLAVPETSNVALPVGFRSGDDTTIVGRQGYLFLHSGNNDLLAQYLAEPGSPKVIETACAWERLVSHRAMRLAGKCRFVQIMIPEKTSALSSLFPRPLQTPSPIYRDMIDRMKRYPDIMVLDCFPILRENTSFFTKLDSHLSSRGCHEIFRHLLATLSLPPMGDLAFAAVDTAGGDLGTHLVGNPVAEVLTDELALTQPGIDDSALSLIEQVQGQGHTGTRCVWSNPSAPIDLKVVAFANSFFDTGETPRRLSWWCARWFREFHFVWTPSVEDDYIDAIRPDIVIAQTIERFLARLPGS